ncbi:hypothetical protein M501DRAFT_1030119 [Patellaria atrata CBS 101060]|uniref:Uncharacterized protein n=1 Tax=Patellaria atrata CBS 101060 TaxID=1346257 RepID=A0A9P4SEK5_9PEZI|nr:hypothetical protein M501DRAFT_1030119 [Patellaria atrata CBS 101060]
MGCRSSRQKAQTPASSRALANHEPLNIHKIRREKHEGMQAHKGQRSPMETPPPACNDSLNVHRIRRERTQVRKEQRPQLTPTPEFPSTFSTFRANKQVVRRKPVPLRGPGLGNDVYNIIFVLDCSLLVSFVRVFVVHRKLWGDGSDEVVDRMTTLGQGKYLERSDGSFLILLA